MFEVIWNWLWQNSPILFGIFVAIVITCFLTLKISAVINRLKKNENTLENEVIPKLTDIEKKTDSLTINLTNLISYFKGKGKGFDFDMFFSSSPIQLTEFGKEVLETSGAKKFIDDNLEKLISLVEEEKVTVPIDIENAIMLIFYNEYDTEKFTPIKNFIFNNPVYTKDNSNTEINVSVIIKAMAIYMRNKYLERHPEINQG